MINYLARIEFLAFFIKHVHQNDLHNRFRDLQHNFLPSFMILYLFPPPGCLSCQTAAAVTMARRFWPTSTSPRTLSDRYEGTWGQRHPLPVEEAGCCWSPPSVITAVTGGWILPEGNWQIWKNKIKKKTYFFSYFSPVSVLGKQTHWSLLQ